MAAAMTVTTTTTPIIDLGDVVTLAVSVVDSAGDAADPSGGVVLTVTLPNGTTTTPSVSNPSTGSYTADYTPTVAGRHSIRWVGTGTNAAAVTDAFTVLDPTVVPVVSLGLVKAHLNLTSTTHDEELRRMIDTVTQVGEQVTGRVFGRRTVTAEEHDGGKKTIVLRRVPAISITSVTEDGTALTSSDYELSPNGSGVLYRVDSGGTPQKWENGTDKNCISVTYEAGYTVQPAGDVHGALEMIRHLWESQRGSMTAYPRDLNAPPGPQANVMPGFSIPARVHELWSLDRVPGIA